MNLNMKGVLNLLMLACWSFPVLADDLLSSHVPNHLIKANAALILFVSLLILSGCAVNKQGNTTEYRLDPGDLTATVVQEFQTISGGRAVLRRKPDGQYQIKLYDRNRVIDLGKMSDPFVDRIAKVNDYDLISVGDVTRICKNPHKLVQVKGYDVYVWDFNNAAGSCSLPLEFAVDGQSWKISQQVSNADRETWTWTAGRLTNNIQRFSPVPGLPNQRQTPNNGIYHPPANSNNTELDKNGPFPGVEFEKTEPVAKAPPRKPLPRISEGSYTKPSPGIETEVPPIRVILKEKN